MIWHWRKQLRAFLYLGFLAPFFFATYGLANWLASQRPSVPSVFFPWERSIPFLPWTIVPYWSSDLLYGVSVFLCRNKRELQTHVNRLIAAQLLCIVSFVLFPLRFAFTRPETDGLFGAMFDALTGFDKPFNQAPSLHVTLLVVLWPLFSKYVPGWFRYVLFAGFLLIGVSTLTTYQHHFIDLPLGFAAGLISLGLFPSAVTRVGQLRRMTAAYATVALLLGAMAISWGGLWYVLLWPCLAVALVAIAYWFDKPALVTPSIVLAPYSLAAAINAWLWTHGRPAANQIVDDIWLGRVRWGARYGAEGFRSVVRLAPEIPCFRTAIPEHRIPMLDLVWPSPQNLQQAIEAIKQLENARPTLICCALGYGRSAAVGASWLLATGRAETAAEAISMVKASRPGAVFGTLAVRQLQHFADRRLREFSL